MSTHFQHYKSGNIFGIKYNFDNVGDGIPEHQHDSTHAHNMVATRGAVEIYFPTTKTTINLVAGETFDFDWTQPHGIKAIEDNSSIINFFLYGQPEGYDTLPPEELQGSFDAPLKHFNH